MDVEDETDNAMDVEEPQASKSTTTPSTSKGKGEEFDEHEHESQASDLMARHEKKCGRSDANLPWVEKYRPKALSDLVSHEEIITTLDKLITEDRLPHLLLYGPPGTGKTSTILAVARRMYGDNYSSMILELNASDDRGIGVVRDQIKDFASTRKLFSTGHKLVILDEADHMTSAAQAALRRVIEKSTRNTRFCLICNYVSKIIPALQSRCTRFRFAPLLSETLGVMLDRVIESEKVNIDEGGKAAIIKLSSGDMRKGLNILQSTNMAYDEVNEANVYLCTGNPLPQDIKNICNWLLNCDFQTAYNNVKQVQTLRGLALQDIVHDLHLFFLKIQFADKQKIYLLDQLSQIEIRLSVACNESVQLASLVGCCQIVRNQAAAAST